MMIFENEDEVLEFIDIMNRKALECMIDAIMSSVVRVQTENGDVEPVKIGYEGFNKVFGGNNGKDTDTHNKQSSDNK